MNNSMNEKLNEYLKQQRTKITIINGVECLNINDLIETPNQLISNQAVLDRCSTFVFEFEDDVYVYLFVFERMAENIFAELELEMLGE